MFKRKLFLVTLALSAAGALFMRVYAYLGELKAQKNIPLDAGFLSCTAFIGIVMAAFCSLFIGTEYSEGTIRNKLVVGHSRGAVYLSGLIICATAGVVFLSVFWIVSLAVGIPLSGFFTGSVSSILIPASLSVVLVIAYCSIFVLVAMSNQNKAMVSVICLLLAFVLLFASTFIYSSLNEPEYYDSYSYTVNGITVYEEAHANPNYLKGTEREVYEFLFDSLPGCQGSRISQMYKPGANPVFALYSLIIAVAATAAGLMVFRKKNIK